MGARGRSAGTRAAARRVRSRSSGHHAGWRLRTRAWLGRAVATVVLFHSVLGVRVGVLDAAARLRADGHQVVVPDLFEGRNFDAYETAMAFAWEDLGPGVLTARALDAVDGLPDDLLPAGFSLGCVMAVHIAT